MQEKANEGLIPASLQLLETAAFPPDYPVVSAARCLERVHAWSIELLTRDAVCCMTHAGWG